MDKSGVGGLEQTYGILTDADAAMAAAIRAACPTKKHLLCRWHIQRNVEAHLRTSLQTYPEREDITTLIMSQWYKLVEHDDSTSFPMAKAAFLDSLDVIRCPKTTHSNFTYTPGLAPVWDKRHKPAAKLAPEQKSKKVKKTSRETTRAMTPWAEQVIKLSKMTKTRQDQKHGRTIVGDIDID
ncbi:hypothetical protein BLNAU_17911 [Blattamonas nauphoetae]|uniref:MULE transposase domain-containing protein n=1 Tax=Blattamonas nauphoetae TaxID=2049346 RepID=A0ABQ9X5V3_9EUKA|nr:hypothetical protein BLNAU_17911 [Blattamonas nauphoetae]